MLQIKYGVCGDYTMIYLVYFGLDFHSPSDIESIGPEKCGIKAAHHDEIENRETSAQPISTSEQMNSLQTGTRFP